MISGQPLSSLNDARAYLAMLQATRGVVQPLTHSRIILKEPHSTLRLTRREFLNSALAAGALPRCPPPAASCRRTLRAPRVLRLSTVPTRGRRTLPPTFLPQEFYWAPPPPPIRSKAHGMKTAKANRSGTASRTHPARSRLATPAIPPAMYHRWREDIALVRAMNLTSYRFSISLPRIQPAGTGPANPQGIDYYSRLVDASLEARIRPFVTLYHWDLPQALEDAGGWPNRDTSSRFGDYVEAVARALGDRVSDWMLFNEPSGFIDLGYLEGTHAPGRKSLIDFLRASHTVNLAQGTGFRALKAARPSARVGTAFNMSAWNRQPTRKTTNSRPTAPTPSPTCGFWSPHSTDAIRRRWRFFRKE